MKIDNSCLTILSWWRLIKSNMTWSSNTKNLKVYSSTFFNFVLIFLALCSFSKNLSFSFYWKNQIFFFDFFHGFLWVFRFHLLFWAGKPFLTLLIHPLRCWKTLNQAKKDFRRFFIDNLLGLLLKTKDEAKFTLLLHSILNVWSLFWKSDDELDLFLLH